jgi:pyruvate dehydrogenase E2 component (dihydrolipoamide acetyltransferase)
MSGPSAAFLAAEAEVFETYSIQPRTRKITLQKPALTLRAIEVGSGQPAFFMHGLGSNSSHWASLMSRLSSLHMVAIDMPGHGASEGVDYRGVDLRAFNRDLVTGCLDALGFESAHIIGHSQGAMFGLWLALDAPKRVRSVVALGTPAVAFGEGHPPAFLRLASRHGIGQLVLSMPTPLFMYRRMMAGFLGRHAVDSAPEAFIRASYLGARGGSHAKTISSLTHEMFRGVRAEPPRYALSDSELARIDKPVLIIWGQGEDGLVMSVADGRRMAAQIPKAKFEVVPGGHEPWLDSLDTCAKLISEFHSQPSFVAPGR